MVESPRFGMNMEPELREALDKKAAELHITVTAMVRMWLWEKLGKDGVEKNEQSIV